MSATEVAVVSLRRNRLVDAAARGETNAKVVNNLRDNPDRFAMTLRVARMLLLLGVALPAGAWEMRREAEVQGWPDPMFATGFLLALAAALLVFGELVPQALARLLSERVAMRLGRWTAFVAWWLTPLGVLIEGAVNVILLPFGKRTSFAEARVSEEEIQELLREASKLGMVDGTAGAIASRAMDFGRLNVREVMVPRIDVVSISVHASLVELKQAFLESGHTRLPVFDRTPDEVIGYISAKDVLAITFEQQLFVVQDVLRPAYFVSQSMRAVKLLEQLQERCMHMAFVAGVDGGFEGIVTMEDLLEELVGDIFSEHDRDVETPIRRAEDGTLVVDGAAPVRDINRELATALPEGNGWSSVAGLCIALAGRIPKAGDKVVGGDGTVFEVLEASHRRIRTVRVHRSASASEAPSTGEPLGRAPSSRAPSQAS